MRRLWNGRLYIVGWKGGRRWAQMPQIVVQFQLPNPSSEVGNTNIDSRSIMDSILASKCSKARRVHFVEWCAQKEWPFYGLGNLSCNWWWKCSREWIIRHLLLSASSSTMGLKRNKGAILGSYINIENECTRMEVRMYMRKYQGKESLPHCNIGHSRA